MPAKLLRVSSATPILGHLGAEEVTDGRTLPPPYAVLKAQRQVPAEWAGWVSRNLAGHSGTLWPWSRRESRGEGSSSREDIRVVSHGATIGRADEWSPLVPNASGPGGGKQRRRRERVLFTAGLAAVRPVQPITADPKASTHHNSELAAFRPVQIR